MRGGRVYGDVRVAGLILATWMAAGATGDQEQSGYTFGTTVVDLSALEGRVYLLDPKTEKLPNFEHMKPVGSVYATSLNVWPQSFSEGFPGLTDRFEWFAIVYTGKFWIEKPGEYRFSLLSDDGAKLRVDGKLLVNNDGIHRADAASAGATLSRGAHEIEVEYFQGPRFTLALVLAVSPPGEQWRIFNTNDFKPPPDPSEWKKGKISGIKPQTIR